MSPEYRVEIAAPYIYTVQAENEEAAARMALELFVDGDQGVDPLAPAEIEAVEMLGPEGTPETQPSS